MINNITIDLVEVYLSNHSCLCFQTEDFEYQVEKMKQCLEDITSVCVLEGFSKQEHLMMVDTVLKELGRAEAGLAAKHRAPVMTSPHFVAQYFTSFSEDPILK